MLSRLANIHGVYIYSLKFPGSVKGKKFVKSAHYVLLCRVSVPSKI